MITIIGIPFGLQSLKLGMLAIWPFGSKVKWKPSQPGCLSIFMNVLWFFVGGIWIWLTHIFYGLIFCITTSASHSERCTSDLQSWLFHLLGKRLYSP